MNRSFRLLVALALAAGVSACSRKSPESSVRTPTVPIFSPSTGDVPVPNDLLFSGSLDGTLNIPVANPMDTSDPQVALNALDGWSTTAPFVVRFSRGVLLSTVVPGTTIRMFEVTTDTSTVPVGGPVTGVVRELVGGTEFSVQRADEYPNGTAIRIVPEAALLASFVDSMGMLENRTYMVVLTNGITDFDGFALGKDTEYLFASDTTPFPPSVGSLAQLQALVNAMESAAEAAGVDRSSIVLSMQFTTQSVGAGLGTTLGIANGNEAAIIAALCPTIPNGCADTSNNPFSTPTGAAGGVSIGTTDVFLGGGPGFGDVYIGQLMLPYYLTAASNATFDQPVTDLAPVTEHWRARYPYVAGDTDQNVTRFNPLPEANSAETIPLLITLPNAASGQMVPAGGWPVVIFQHGIGGDRTNMLAIADALSAVGFAVIASDLPLHGLDPSNPLFLGYVDGGLRERTFGLDVLDNATGAPMPDGVIDASGANFINLRNLLVSRDNLRQGVTDLFNLVATIGTFQVGGEDLDPTRIHFVGHSLGGIVGTPFVATQPGITAATLGMPGGAIPYLLNGSTVFGPVVQAGLASVGVQPGTPDYESFLFAAQGVVDAADPVNHGAAIATAGLPTYLIEVVGGGPMGGVPDLVVPNSVPGRPLAGTEPLITALGLTDVTATTMDAAGVRGAVRFIEGDHSSLLLPTTSAAATAEMQGQAASFHASDGTQIVVTDNSVIDTMP